MANDRKIIVAVDFGTTFSGLAWAQTRKPGIQTPVIQWPDATSGGLEGATSDKVPTEIQYTSGSYKWGFQIPDYGQRHQWFKLGLDPAHGSSSSSTLARDFPDPNAAPPEYNHRPEKLVTDYLTALRKHAEQILRYKLPESALISTPIEFVITTPAVWSDLAQQKTRNCAESAGMGTGSALHIISEPEAAAIYALDAMDPHDIKIGDTFVLCDAGECFYLGGGTVDLISYKVSALRPVLQIAEAAPGSGSSCGSTFLNRIFQKFLRDKLGDDPSWEDEVLEEAMKRFEMTVKRSFTDTDGEEYHIPVIGLRDSVMRDVRRGRLRLSRSDIQAIFKPVVEEVIALIMGQIAATKDSVKAILLVGGFGQNAYLRDRVRRAVGSKGIEVMQSPNGWTAVVRGALMKGLSSTNEMFSRVNVSGRCARKHYGIESHKTFDPVLHAQIADKSFYSDFEGQQRVTTMDWFIKKGSLVAENKPVRLRYYRKFLHSEGPPSNITEPILVYKDPEDSGAPMQKTDQVFTLVNVDADLSRIPSTSLPMVLGKDNKLYYRLDYEIEITYFSAYTKYELIYDGVNYGPVTAEYV